MVRNRLELLTAESIEDYLCAYLSCSEHILETLVSFLDTKPELLHFICKFFLRQLSKLVMH